LVILYDSGNALYNLESLDDFKNNDLISVEYKHDIHQLLSPNDNNWHGPPKRKWRQLFDNRMVDKMQDVESSLLLLKCNMMVLKFISKKNLFLGKKKSK